MADDAFAPTSGSFGPEHRLPSSFASGPLVNLGGGRVAQLILTPRSLNMSVPSVAIGAVDGPFGAPLAIHGTVFANRVSLAGNPQGDLLVSWIAADVHGQHRTVWASVRQAGGRFGAPQLLSSNTNPNGVWAAIGRAGVTVMVVAFDDGRGRMLARVRQSVRRNWGATDDLGVAAVGTENDVTPYVSDVGEVVVAWYHTQLCEGGCESPGFTEVAALPVGRRRFRATQLLARDPTALQGVPADRSRAPVVLSRRFSAPMIVFLAAAPVAPGSPPTPAVVKIAHSVGSGYSAKGSGFAAPRTLSSPAEQASDVAAALGPSGEIVTWIREDPPAYVDGTVFAAVTVPAPGSPFGPPVQVSPSEHVGSALVTFNAASHWPHDAVAPWIVAWTGRPQGGSPGTTVNTMVRVSMPICPVPMLPMSPSAPPIAPIDPACIAAQR